MHLVRVRVDRSAIHGFGVFAAESISRGSPVWRFSPGFDLDLDPALVEAQPPHFREYLMRYGAIEVRSGRLL